MIELEELKVSKVLNSLPLIFERNIGQHDEKVQFVLNKKECTTFFTDTELVLAFRSNEKIEKDTVVKIVRIEGVKLVVRPINKQEAEEEEVNNKK